MTTVTPGLIGHIVLVGLPGSGKSTLGPLLGARLGRRSVDIDAEVETHTGRTVAEIFADHGEAHFRAEEAAALERTLAATEPLVISAGGGLIAQHGAAAALTHRATVVWLDAADLTLAERVAGAAPRPLLGSAAAERLTLLRHERAEAHAHAVLHVDTTDAPNAVVERLGAVLANAVRVRTPQPYLVSVAPGALATVADHLPAAARRALLLADEAVPEVTARVRGALEQRGVATTVVPVVGGEPLKRWTVVGGLLETCAEARLDREDCIVAIGGGTVGDVAGFVAATYLRGVAWMGVPTTLLAMVDSAVGGKTGVNLRTGKNLAGAFWQPRAVICDPTVLTTLPSRSHRSAFAEIIKSSMVGGGDLPGLVEARLGSCLERDPEAVAEVVRECCALKAEVIGGDEREGGRRAILNYGHTVGHAVEALTGFGRGPDHGEAVAFGMRVAGVLSRHFAGCDPADIAWQDEMLDRCGLNERPALDAAAIGAVLGGDKKARNGVPRWVLLRGRGRPVTGIVLDEPDVRAALVEAGAR